jgi:hypothetical protein
MKYVKEKPQTFLILRTNAACWRVCHMFAANLSYFSDVTHFVKKLYDLNKVN